MSLFVRILAAMAVLALPTVGLAEDPTKEDIVRALDPKAPHQALTRSFSRGVTVEKAAPPAGPPMIDLYVNFAFDSDALQTDSLIVLDRLADALGDPRLASYRFLIAGHTDAKGSTAYNQSLSERRAAAVVSYLSRKPGVDRTRLVSKGFGESQLADPSTPEAAVNRRVQIVNLVTAASN